MPLLQVLYNSVQPHVYFAVLCCAISSTNTYPYGDSPFATCGLSKDLDLESITQMRYCIAITDLGGGDSSPSHKRRGRHFVLLSDCILSLKRNISCAAGATLQSCNVLERSSQKTRNCRCFFFSVFFFRKSQILCRLTQFRHVMLFLCIILRFFMRKNQPKSSSLP